MNKFLKKACSLALCVAMTVTVCPKGQIFYTNVSAADTMTMPAAHHKNTISAESHFRPADS